MRIVELSIANYKSLRDVTFTPGSLNALVGPNDSGKSNFADALDFLSDVYKDGLTAAVSRKGGFENIAHRMRQRSKSAVRCSITVEGGMNELFGIQVTAGTFQVHHDFAFRTRGAGIKAEYYVVDESISVRQLDPPLDILAVDRHGADVGGNRLGLEDWLGLSSADGTEDNLALVRTTGFELADSELLLSRARTVTVLNRFREWLAALRVFQFSAARLRGSSAPVPSPVLDRYGANLPTVIDFIQRAHPDVWDDILAEMRIINRNLEAIEVDYTHTRMLGLFFREKGARRPWNSDEVSDGTLQTLALFTAIHDPQTTFLLLEEPENSVHPWIIRRIAGACRKASERRQIVLTTHSLTLVDALTPEEIWVIWRDKGASQLHRLNDVEPAAEAGWEKGKFSLSEFLDGGLFRPYAPAGVQ